ncbi:uncharacterized protein NPIL_247851 [Nephila pilipes]|uniref:Uncharacterized protein n=1 Tax=Nephila pilipes TaxID=299642 RepID=A0A8X6QPU1_NEPPI|nr:uncharacterized protein NPIL_247851 [Nephila pilipes]
MSTEHFELNCFSATSVSNIEPPKESPLTTVQNQLATDSKCSSYSSLEYESYSSDYPESSPPSEEKNKSSDATKTTMDSNFDSSGQNVVVDPRRRFTFLDEPQILGSHRETPFYSPDLESVNITEQIAYRFQEVYETYKRHADIIRNSKYYKFGLHCLLLAISISALYLGVIYLNECFLDFKKILLVLLMGMAGVGSTLFRVVPMAFARCTTSSEWKLENVSKIFLLMFIMMAVVEILVMTIVEKNFFCTTSIYYIVYINFGLFVLGIIAICSHLDVILKAFVSSIRNVFRMICAWFE